MSFLMDGRDRRTLLVAVSTDKVCVVRNNVHVYRQAERDFF